MLVILCRVEQIFVFRFLIEIVCQKSHANQMFFFDIFFSSFREGPPNLQYQLGFFINGNCFLRCGFCRCVFICVLFLIYEDYGINLNVSLPSESTS